MNNRRFSRQSGASLVEYVLLVSIILFAVFIATQSLGEATRDKYTEIACKIGGGSESSHPGIIETPCDDDDDGGFFFGD